MAKLTTKKRAALPANVFAGPGRSYPIEDKNHARAAIVDASRAENAGRLSAAEAARIQAKAEKKLKK